MANPARAKRCGRATPIRVERLATQWGSYYFCSGLLPHPFNLYPRDPHLLSIVPNPNSQNFLHHEITNKSAQFRPRNPEGHVEVAWVQINNSDPETLPVMVQWATSHNGIYLIINMKAGRRTFVEAIEPNRKSTHPTPYALIMVHDRSGTFAGISGLSFPVSSLLEYRGGVTTGPIRGYPSRSAP